MQQLSHLMNQIKSVLLPGSFFEDDYVNKTKYLLSNEIDTIYLFDHSIISGTREADLEAMQMIIQSVRIDRKK